MTVLINHGECGGELPEYECQECDARFSIVWHRHLLHTTFRFCPFCGDEIEGTIDADDEQEGGAD